MKRKWGYDDVMDYAKKERDSVPSVPWIKFNQEFLDAEKDVDWADVSSASNQQLQKLLTIYGGGKAILEHVVATLRAKVGAISAIFDEEYNAAFAKFMSAYDGKKPTRDEARGLIMSSHEHLKDLFKKKVELETSFRYEEGRMNPFSQCYNTLSRIVSLRTDKNL